MLRAVAEINGAIPVHLHVFGDGPLESDLKRLARELGIHEIVSWHGFQLNPFPVVSRADLVLLTSDYEGLPNALIEAQGLGVPAVSTACPTGPDEIIEDGVTGLLVAVGDSSAIAEAATRILGDEGRRRTMASAARLRMHRLFEAETVTRQWEFLFVDTLPRREDR
jgi:glycosyltransferase involved in cell wall biosynthesis